MGKVDDSTVEGGEHSTLTDPAQAARFVEETGVDCLAVSIGNAHDIYAKLPGFDFERLEKICKAIGIPLVLRGGSGTQPENIRKAAAQGMAKINVASELCRAHHEPYAENMKDGKGAGCPRCWPPPASAWPRWWRSGTGSPARRVKLRSSRAHLMKMGKIKIRLGLCATVRAVIQSCYIDVRNQCKPIH